MGDVNGDGFADFMIGAPAANDSTGTANAAGRAYLIYGGTEPESRPNKTVDLDNPTANSDLNILTFVNNIPNAATGRAVSSAGDILADGLPDIAIGAPNASVNGAPNSGAVYVISGACLRPARTQTIAAPDRRPGRRHQHPGRRLRRGDRRPERRLLDRQRRQLRRPDGRRQIQATLLIGSPAVQRRRRARST